MANTPTAAQQKVLNRMATEGRVLSVSKFANRYYEWNILRIKDDGTLDGSEPYRISQISAGTARALVRNGFVVPAGERWMGQFARDTFELNR